MTENKNILEVHHLKKHHVIEQYELFQSFLSLKRTLQYAFQQHYHL